MKYKLSDIIIGLIFIELIIGTSFMQPYLKSETQIYMILFGIITLITLLMNKSFKTSILFLVLIWIMIYSQILVLTTNFVNILNPNDGWVTDNNGNKGRVMQMNWIWGVLAGIVFSSLAIILYYKKIHRNRVLEIILTTIFILLSAIIFAKNEVL